MLKPFETKDNKDGAINYYDMGIIDTNTWWQGGAWMNEKSGNMYAISTSVETYKLLNVWGWGNTANFYFNGHSPLFVTFNLGLELQADKSGAGDNDKDCYFASGNALTVTAEVLKSDGTVVKSGNVIIHRSTYTGSTSGYDVDMVHDEKAIMGTGSQSDNYFRLNPQLKFYINKDDFGSYFYFRLKFKWVNNTTPFIYDDGPQSFIGNLTITTNNGCTIQTQLAQGIKSNSEFTLNDLWNNDYNIFEEIIRYCKMYRISISVDELNKKIVFKPFNKYFENYTVEDWTDKVDKSKDYTITPITFENKYVLFDYKDSETKLGKEYKEKYGVNYGERVAFYTSGTATNSSAVQVAKVYRNPHKFAYIGNSPFFDYTISGNVSFPLQGRYNSGGIGYFYLTPRYPYLSTTNYRLLLSSEESSNVSSSYLKVVGKMVGNQRTIPFTYPSSFVSYNLSDLYSDLAPSNYTGSFGHFHQGISDDFNMIVRKD